MLVNIVVQVVINSFLLWFASQVISGIHFDGNWLNLLAVGAIFGVINALIKPILVLLTLPLTVLTLGIFALILNALLLLLTAWLAPSYSVDGFFPALWGSILISIASTVINWIRR